MEKSIVSFNESLDHVFRLSEKDWKTQFEKCKSEIVACTEWKDFLTIFE